jgi:Tol biopolymer transport system component
MKRRIILLLTLLCWLGPEGQAAERRAAAKPPAADDAVAALATEVANLGWILYSGRSEQGDWEIFACRPNGADIHHLTQTPDRNEFSPQVSRDGQRLLYRRLPRNVTIDNNRHGTQGELVLANSDGSQPRVLGAPETLTWASWSPDGQQIACLSIKGVSFIDLATLKEVRRLPRKGFFQQMTWSPDGKWLIGVANSYGVSWSIGRMNVETGEASVVHRIDCCTPDWFPDSRQVIFSWRPPGQKSNPGYGWTQLWRTDLDGKSPQLVYGEDGRHVYGGHVSPDGKYVLLTGNMQEDGDPGNAGAPMGLLRLSDAPIIGGESTELRAVHPRTNSGPVLTLPAGWEPCWTSRDILPRKAPAAPPQDGGDPATDDQSSQLVSEVHDSGWIVLSVRGSGDNWDLFQMRPDGSDRRQITDTPELNEAGARFSHDGRRLLYYRMPRAEKVDNNTYGLFELVLSDADGGHAEVWGKNFPWASWGPDDTQVACLLPDGIRVYDVATRQVERTLPRHGLVQQLMWSPDGHAFAGTANGLGPFWNIGALDCQSETIQRASENDRYNCTPDWCPDSSHVVYARGIVPQDGGFAELWSAAEDGTDRQRLYAEPGIHIYGACPSPDGRYLLFTRSVEDLGPVDNSQTTVSIIRWPGSVPAATSAPRLDLGPGWEPHWTGADLAREAKGPSK